MEISTFVTAIDPWFRDRNGPVSTQLSLAVRQAISTGLLEPGDRLPPERALASALHVSRPTISTVINDLRDSGLVTSRQGSGSWIATTLPPSTPTVPFAEWIHTRGLIDLAAATAPDAGLVAQARVETADLLASEPANGLNPVGLESLRNDIARRQQRSTPITADNVVVTAGAHQALAMLVATQATRGQTILVEETTYGGLVDLAHSHGLRVVGVERDEHGPLPASLELLLDRHRPAMVVLVSSVHSPTGRVTAPDRCDELADILLSATVQIVLDETYADLEFAPTPPRLAIDLDARAIRIGSLSKSIWTGLRTGWILAPVGVCESIVARRWSQFDLGPSVAGQLFAQRAMTSLDEALPLRRDQLRRRCEWLTQALAHRFPHWSITSAAGGLALWVDLGDHDGSDYAAQAADHGVAVLPGTACRADRGPSTHIRICFDRPIDVLEAAVERLPRSGPSALSGAHAPYVRSRGEHNT